MKYVIVILVVVLSLLALKDSTVKHTYEGTTLTVEVRKFIPDINKSDLEQLIILSKLEDKIIDDIVIRGKEINEQGKDILNLITKLVKKLESKGVVSFEFKEVK